MPRYGDETVLQGLHPMFSSREGHEQKPPEPHAAQRNPCDPAGSVRWQGAHESLRLWVCHIFYVRLKMMTIDVSQGKLLKYTVALQSLPNVLNKGWCVTQTDFSSYIVGYPVNIILMKRKADFIFLTFLCKRQCSDSSITYAQQVIEGHFLLCYFLYRELEKCVCYSQQFVFFDIK